jgi:CheY-like chemotaxis protein
MGREFASLNGRVEESRCLVGGERRKAVLNVSNSDRPSPEHPAMERAGSDAGSPFVYVDDSATALSTMRRAIAAHALRLDTYESLDALRMRPADRGISVALLDVDLGDGVKGPDVAREILSKHPRARIAFITADANPARVAELRSTGPVFDKLRDVAGAVKWLVAEARRVGRPA